MPEFQGGQFLPYIVNAQNKEEQGKDYVLKQLGQSVGQGAIGGQQQYQQQQKSQYDTAVKLLLNKFDKMAPVKIKDPNSPMGKNNIVPLTIDEEIKLANSVASGSGMPQGVTFVDRDFLKGDETSGKGKTWFVKYDAQGNMKYYDENLQPATGTPPPGANIKPIAASQVENKSAKDIQEANKNFHIASNKLKTTFSAFKAMSEFTGATGRLAGVANWIGGETGANPYVKSYEGQLVEAASSLAKLAAPSARVGEQIIAQFKKTLPTKWSTFDEAVTQTRVSLRNAFATVLGANNKEFTREHEQMIDDLIREIKNVEPMSLESLEKEYGKSKTPVQTKVPRVGEVRGGKKVQSIEEIR